MPTIDAKLPDFAAAGPEGRPGFLEILVAIEQVTGLEASVYPPEPQPSPAVEALPISYRRHMSPFCLAAKKTRDGRGCRGFDAWYTTRKAGEVGRPFVQICCAGVAEVIVPVFRGPEHLATICLGQAITEVVQAAGFAGVWGRVQGSGVDREALQEGYGGLPVIPEERLLQMGLLLEAAVRGLTETISEGNLVRDVRLQRAPAVRKALEILEREKCLRISQQAMARRVNLTVSHFSRLFHEVMDKTFTEHLTDLRMGEAQQLLHHTSIPINDVAHRCGYERQSYFTRRFRERMGLTPTAYRNRRQEAAPPRAVHD